MNSQGQWPRQWRHRLQQPLWRLAGSCPQLGQRLLQCRLNAWRHHRRPLPRALATAVLRERLMLNVPPSTLQQRLLAVGTSPVPFDFRHQFIIAGDVTAQLTPIAESELDAEMVQLFAEGMQWRQTQAYQQLIERLHSAGSFRHNNVRLAQPQDIDRYFERYVRLVDSIERYGYQTRAALTRLHSGSMRRQWWLESGEQEVGVAIGPHGQIWRFGGGYHRTAIARLLNLATMPVMIRVVHDDWWQKDGCQLVSGCR